MARTIIAVVFILLAGGSWFYLDTLNKEEKVGAEEIRKAVDKAQARAVAEEKQKAEAKAQFESEINIDLSNCKAAAEKANNDYIILHQKPVRHHSGQFTITQVDEDEAAKMLESAKAECQQTYETRLKNGV